MIHPLFKTLVSQPELLAEHAGAYAELAAVEAVDLGVRVRRRAQLWLLMGASAAVAVGMAGVALMLFAAIPSSTMPAPWLVMAVPAVPALIAAGCAFALRRPAGWRAFATLREQWSTDRALWREVTREQAP